MGVTLIDSDTNTPVEILSLTDGESMPSEDKQSQYLAVSDTVRQIHAWFRSSRAHRVKWRTEASEWYRIYNGDQYSDADKKEYDEVNRPRPVFNRVAPIVQTVVGLAHDDDQNVVYKAIRPYSAPRSDQSMQQGLPVEPQQPSTPTFTESELVQSACGFFERKCSAQDEDLEAFRDMVICGEGWGESFVSVNADAKVDPKRVRVNPFEMFPDSRSERKNYSDARFIIRARNYRKADLIALYPSKRKEIIAAGNNANLFDPSISVSYDIGNTGVEVAKSGYFEVDRLIYDNQEKMTVLECQWYDYEQVLYVTFPDKTTKAMSDASYRKFVKELGKQGIKSIGDPLSIRQKVYKRAFIMGNLELSSRRSPLNDQFTYKCMTGERDQVGNYYYGVVRNLSDPQRYSNIFMGTILHIINTNAKGGIMAERGAFDDTLTAEAEYAKADSITWLADGSIGKIVPKPTTPMPAALSDLLTYANSSMNSVSGVSADMMGLNPNPQAMILEDQRRKVGKKLLSPYFSALKRYRHDSGVAFWRLIKEYVDPERLIIIGELDNQQAIQLSILNDDFEVNVEVTEGFDANKNTEVIWDSLSKLLPGMMQAGIPIPPSIVSLIPAPDKLRKEWADLIRKAAEPAQPTQVEQALAMESEAKAKESDSKVQLNIAKASNLQIDTATKEKELLTPNQTQGYVNE
jgi:hypothetical protein